METSTKSKIALAFENLLETKSFEDITTRNIVDSSGVSRATFYRHFKDKYEVMGYGCKNSLESFFEPYMHGRSLQTIHEDFSGYLYSKKEFFYKAMKTEGPNSFENTLIESSIDLFNKIYEGKSVRITPDIAHITELYCYGSAAFLRRWAAGGFKEPPEYISKITYACIPEAIKKYL